MDLELVQGLVPGLGTYSVCVTKLIKIHTEPKRWGEIFSLLASPLLSSKPMQC